MRTTVDLIDHSPALPLNVDLPNRVQISTDVSYDKFRVFDYRAFVHVPKDEWFKLDEKLEPCIFMGYDHEQFGYRLWDRMNKKIVRSRDAFLEDQLTDDGYKDERCNPFAEFYVILDPIPLM